MKLTKNDREAFVRAVIDDVPQIDYDEQAQKLATELSIATLPEIVQDAHRNKLFGPYLCTEYTGLPGCLDSFYAPPREGLNLYEHKALKALSEKKREQNRTREALRENLAAVIGGCSTLKQALERLPEFEKYLPADRGGSGLSNLPAIANVVAELTKAGWPKGQERAAA